MTEVATRDEQTAVATRPEPLPVPAGAAENPLVVWAYAASQANRIAQSLANTSFVPASLRGKPGDITAAILAGQELGLQPMATLRSLDVIQGTPALRAHAMRGLVQSRGHEVELLETTDTLCRMRGRRKGAEAWQEITWTIEQARALGLLSRDQWKKQPATMLIARATGAICRLIASDVLHAMPYASEELGDDDRPVSGGPTVTVRVTKAEIMGAAPEPVADEPQRPDDEDWPPAAVPGGEA